MCYFLCSNNFAMSSNNKFSFHKKPWSYLKIDLNQSCFPSLLFLFSFSFPFFFFYFFSISFSYLLWLFFSMASLFIFPFSLLSMFCSNSVLIFYILLPILFPFLSIFYLCNLCYVFLYLSFCCLLIINFLIFLLYFSFFFTFLFLSFILSFYPCFPFLALFLCFINLLTANFSASLLFTQGLKNKETLNCLVSTLYSLSTF